MDGYHIIKFLFVNFADNGSVVRILGLNTIVTLHNSNKMYGVCQTALYFFDINSFGFYRYGALLTLIGTWN